MKRQKMITLCPTTYEIAQGMPNFSEWVRSQLRKIEVNTPQVAPRRIYVCDVCGDVIQSHKSIEGVPHATRYMGVNKKEDCLGSFRREV